MNYDIINKIGEGSYSTVYKIKIDNDEYAMKKINIVGLTNNQKKYLLSEIKIISEHKSAYIIKFFGASIHDDHLHIIMEYTEHGTLDNYMKINKLNNNITWKFFGQLCAAVSYLHKNNIIHRDIKSSNILIDNNSNIKLIDFGVSKILNTYMKYTKSFVGTPLYMSPELFKNVLYDSKIDIWSLGIVLYQMTHESKLPFECKNFQELKIQINTPKIVVNNNILPEFKTIILKCIQSSPHKRIKIETLMSLKGVKQYLTKHDLKFYKNIHQIDKVPIHHNDWENIMKKLPTKLKKPTVQEKQCELLKNHSKFELIKLNERLLHIVTEKNKEIQKLNIENNELKIKLCNNEKD